MESTAYERLSVLDRSFLVFERPGLPMHLGGVAIFEGGPLVSANGTVKLSALRAHVRARLHLAPRYRQRLAFVPIVQRPVWVDAADFDLRRHVRRARLPAPRDGEALRRLAGRLFASPIDRGHPLWELWVIDGLGRDRFALVMKTHHAMADGISAFGLFSALLSQTDAVTADRPRRWRPRPAPGPLALLREEVLRELRAPADLGRILAKGLAQPARIPLELASDVRAIADLVRTGLTPPVETSFNQPVGPERAFDWLALDLGEAKRVRKRLGGTLNDVVLATVAGALRSFLGAGPEERDASCRVVVPVSVRAPAEAGSADNRVSAWLATLPLAEPDPVRRLHRVQAMTERFKRNESARGAAALMRFAEGVPAGLVDLGVRLTAWLHPYNLIVTNVPGPSAPLYLRGSRLRAAYPQVPLFENQGLGIAVFSVDSRLCFGLHADPSVVPDLAPLVSAIRTAFTELCQAAAAGRPVISTSARRSWPGTHARGEHRSAS